MDSWLAPNLSRPINNRVIIPGSKSETNRALVLAALANEASKISGALDSRDSRLMIAGLSKYGVSVHTTSDVLHIVPPRQFHSIGEIDCGLAGTVMRFLPPLTLLTSGTMSFFGDPRASQRPMRPLLSALRQLGASTDANSLPVKISAPRKPGSFCEIDASSSSQFISGLLLIGSRLPAGLHIRHTGDCLPSRPHIEMTISMLRSRGVSVQVLDDANWFVSPGIVSAKDEWIAPDLTNAAVFLAAGLLSNGSVTVPNWPINTTQPGDLFRTIASRMGGQVLFEGSELTIQGSNHLVGIDIDLSAASELTPVVAALALFAHGITRITGVGHIRGHETDRLAALSTEFNAAGGDVTQTDDGLIIVGNQPLRSHKFNSYQDHRMAHAAALVGLCVPGTTLDDINATAKTMPTFPKLWEKLCAG